MKVDTWKNGSHSLSTDKSKLQIDRIHQFLSTEAYWSLDIPKEIVNCAIEGSLCIGLYENELQIGFARVVTDHATFAWICDVYVESKFRGKGLSKWMMECVMSHSSLKGLRRICLATKDAHKLYEKSGFEITKTPQYWMEIKNADIYKKMRQNET